MKLGDSIKELVSCFTILVIHCFGGGERFGFFSNPSVVSQGSFCGIFIRSNYSATSSILSLNTEFTLWNYLLIMSWNLPRFGEESSIIYPVTLLMSICF